MYHRTMQIGLLLWVLLCSTAALAAPPERFNYQARLTDGAGAPLDGPQTLILGIYHGGTAGAANSGTKVYEETASVTANKGVVSHAVGSGTSTFGGAFATDKLLTGLDVYLQAAVGNPSNVVLPRTRLESAPFALVARDALNSADGSTTCCTTVAYQPWWTWWWWGLPWQLGYEYQRVLTVPAGQIIDARNEIYGLLYNDVSVMIADQAQRDATIGALFNGLILATPDTYVPANLGPVLVILVREASFINSTTLAVRYVIVSNKTLTHASPLGGLETPPAPPWVPGRCYELKIALGASASDRDTAIREAHRQMWLNAGQTTLEVDAAMVYFHPRECGWK
jgi:hypothetical protein